MQYSWNYRSQVEQENSSNKLAESKLKKHVKIYMSQKFWLMIACLQFFLLLGVYNSVIMYLALGLILLYGMYVFQKWQEFKRNAVSALSVSYDEQLELHSVFEVRLDLQNYYLQSVKLSFAFDPHPALHWEEGQSAINVGKTSATCKLRAKKLGHFELPAMHLVMKDFAGLFENRTTLFSDDSFEVLPNSQSDNMNELLHILKADPNAMVWKNRQSMARKSDLIVGARDYKPGDPLKLIDAKKTGRLRKPMVKVFEQDEAQHLEVILDVGRSMIGEIEHSQKVDFYTLLAYQLVRYTCSLGDTFSFSTLSHQLQRYVFNSRKSEAFIDVYRNKKIELSMQDAQLEQAVAHIKQLTKPSIVFLLLDMLKPSMHSAMIRLLPQLDPKHKIIVLHVIEEKYNVKHIVAEQEKKIELIDYEDRQQLLYALSLQERKQDLMAKLNRSNVSLVDLPTQHAVGLVRELYKQLRV